MTEKFTASNNMDVVEMTPTVGLYLGDVAFYINERQKVALREYFVAKRDEELGRWRLPENPNWLVYWNEEDSNEVIVFDESDPAEGGVRITREEDRDWPYYQPAARAYFAAHPEPKPWLDAKPGEVWEITYRSATQRETSNRVMTCVDDGGNLSFFNEYRLHTVQYTGIESACRIWPEGETDN